MWSGSQPTYDVVVKRVNSTAEKSRPSVAVLVVSKQVGDMSVELPLLLFGLPVKSAAEVTYKVRCQKLIQIQMCGTV